MQANLTELYNLLLEGKEITLRIASWRVAENIRVALTKKNSEYRAVGISDGVVQFVWSPDKGIAVFKLGRPKRAEAATFEIVDIHSASLDEEETTAGTTELQSALEYDTSEHGTSQSSLPETDAGTSDLCNPETKEPSERSS